jgi:hypothetical protein
MCISLTSATQNTHNYKSPPSFGKVLGEMKSVTYNNKNNGDEVRYTNLTSVLFTKQKLGFKSERLQNEA